MKILDYPYSMRPDYIPKGMIGVVAGLQLYESLLAVSKKQFRFPVSKKKRIRMKWKKQEKNWRSLPCMFKMNDKMYIHPSLKQSLLETINSES